MSERGDSGEGGASTPPPAGPKPPLLYLLVVVLFAECLLLAVTTGLLFYDLLAQKPDSYAGAVAIVILAALAAVWLGVVATHTLAGRSWIRGAALFWQVLQIAIGIASVQGALPRADIGWLLIAPGVIAIALLFMPSVIRATAVQQR